MKKDLFGEECGKSACKEEQLSGGPLAFRMRPRVLDEFVGQGHILGEGKLLRRLIFSDRLTSLIFYGPPGSGKTTLAHVISNMTSAAPRTFDTSGAVPQHLKHCGTEFRTLNAVTSNVQEIRKILDEAKQRKRYEAHRTILFIDEIHRFNKAQQDVLMPEVESGVIILIGATTHNPSFAVNGPLLSRSVIFELQPLTEEDLIKIIRQALQDKERGLGQRQVLITEGALIHLAKNACGDARRALIALEIGVLSTPPDSSGNIHFDEKVAEESIQKKIVHYDHDEDYHYDTASAFIKSMRGSDPDAAVYWLAKMLYAGEDPRFIARRIVILASEDVGNADPQALVIATSAMQSLEFVGMPEARIILAQAVVYLSMAPKSNASYMALEAATADIKEGKTQEVPQHLRDASYRGAKSMGHGQGYQYAHNGQDHFVIQDYLGVSKEYYVPTELGYEKKMAERLQELKRRKSEMQKGAQ